MFVHKVSVSRILVHEAKSNGFPALGLPILFWKEPQMTSTLELPAPLAGRHTRLSDLAFDLLAKAIVDDRLTPGQILRDYSLAKDLGVSRTPVREALQRLERAGLVETMASRHTRVAEIPPQRVADVIEYAGYTYGAAVRVALTRMTGTARDAADALLDVVMNASGGDRLVGATREFFAFVNAEAKNDVFTLRTDLRYLIDRAMNDLPAAIVIQRIEAHRLSLRDAFAGNDGDAAERAVRLMHGIV